MLDATLDSVRRSRVESADPIHAIDFRTFLKEHLRTLVENCGGELAFQNRFIVDVDNDVIRAFENLHIV